MIEVNLLPGASRKARRGRPAGKGMPKLTMGVPSLGGLSERLPNVDRLLAVVILVYLGGFGAIGWLWMGDRSRHAELSRSVEVAVEDSARYAKLIEASARLQARRDTIAYKLQIIQQIDALRFVWPHLLDEISGALPEYTWLTKIGQVESATDEFVFEIRGQTGNNFALTRFMSVLEQSPFIRDVKLTTMDLSKAGVKDEQLVYDFVLVASYEPPPPDIIQTTPIFGVEEP